MICRCSQHLFALSILAVVIGCKEQTVTSVDHTHQTTSGDVRTPQEQITATPLAPAHGGGTKLFELLLPESTGIDFVNKLTSENNVPYVYMGAGVAAGDFDNDGRVDLYLLSVDSPNRLYRQIAQMKFEDVTAAAGGVDGGSAWSRGATFFDADNDGDLDLHVCNTEAPNLFYENQGDGTFRECAAERGLNFVGASVMTGVADYDQDGDLDLYLLTHRTLHYTVDGPLLQELKIPTSTAKTRDQMAFNGRFQSRNGQMMPVAPKNWFRNLDHWEIAGQRDVLYRNNGDGTFTDVTESSGIGNDPGLGLSCTWMDFDRDGLLDLHVANDLQSKDRLYRNNGDGSFTESLSQMLPHTTWFSMGSDFGDVNNDGRFDLFVVDMASTTHYRAKVQMGDMSRFRYFMEREWPAQLMRNSLFLNSGTDRFLEIAPMAGLDATDWTWAAKFNDLDNDGWIDAFVTNGIARADEMNPDLRKQRETIRSREGLDALVNYIRGQPEDATANLAYRNNGKLRFENVSQQWGVDFKGISYAASQVDLDGDGDLDLVASNHNQPVSIYRNVDTQGNRVIVRLTGTRSNRFGIGATVKIVTDQGVQIRQLFPTRGYLTCDEPLVHFGLGNQDQISQLIVQWPSKHRQVFTNLVANQTYSITEPAGEAMPTVPEPTAPALFQEVSSPAGLAFRHKEFEYDDYELQPLLPGKLSQLGPGLAWGDVDNDGDDDLFVGGAAGQSGQLMINDGEAGFRSVDGPWSEDQSCEDMAALWIDHDSDGDLDLFVASGSSEFDPGDQRLADRIYVNDGSLSFTKSTDAELPNGRGSSSAMVAADFDADGDLDLFVGERLIPGDYPATPNSYLLRNDNGKFVDATDEVAPDLRQVGLVTSAVWSDVNGDDRVDLLVAAEWSPIRLFINQDDKLVDRTEAAGLSERSGWWNSIAPGDVDRDGDIDFVALNAGLNTKYRQPTAKKPTMLLYGEMEEGGNARLVEVKSGDEGLLPVRGLSCSSSAMPFLRDKFSTYHDFASSMLTDIYETNCLNEAQRFVANELANGLWINNGDGRFQWQELPFLAQNSPGYGAALTDLDGDGHVDIYFVQNLFTREPETGVWAGGMSWMLRGDGSSRFELVWPNQSGLVVPGDGKAMAVTDTNRDGRPDISATQNNSDLRFFKSSAGGRSLAIRLRGPAGNPTGVGTRISVSFDDQLMHVGEIYAGSGYLSQSSPIVFCGGLPEVGNVAVELRWPDGKVSQHEVEVSQSEVVLSQ